MTNNPPLLDRYLEATTPTAQVTRPGSVSVLEPALRQQPRLVGDLPEADAPPAQMGNYERWGKRAVDLALAIPLLVLMIPIMLIGALVVLVSLGRPVLYRQRRVGLDGQPFEIIKLRTMRPESVIDLRDGATLLEVNERTTAATRLLRRLSLDEFSQLWNVVRGEMSLVGPRPEVWDKALRDDLVMHSRNKVRPGMTGAWQITPARNDDICAGVNHDIRYIERVNLSTDLKILAATPAAIVRSHTE
ncbi:MAG: sugar transferase [Acidimicrobiales bacterium]